jgi:23S rRNA (adenine2503-C2)-methyltransferase
MLVQVKVSSVSKFNGPTTFWNGSLQNIYGLTYENMANHLSGDLESRLVPATAVTQSQASKRADAIFASLYARDGRRPIQINQRALEELKSVFSFLPALTLHSEHQSALDGSTKFVLQTQGGLRIETVLIPEPGRLTACLSTQVGCDQGCRFCQTGRMGLLSNLSAAEIVGQIVFLKTWLENRGQSKASLSNIVFMGMGEPLDNLTEVLSAINILTHDKGFQFSRNKITLSTVGLLKPLEAFLKANPCGLAISLHNPFETERTKLMPVNALNPISEVIALLREFAPINRRAYLIQYTLIRGVNDFPKHAQALADLLKDLPAKINLIPLNEHGGAAFRRPDLDAMFQFQKLLKDRGYVVTVRLSKGRDIAAACGQLIAQQDATEK